jgi:hypothetical protein
VADNNSADIMTVHSRNGECRLFRAAQENHTLDGIVAPRTGRDTAIEGGSGASPPPPAQGQSIGFALALARAKDRA